MFFGAEAESIDLPMALVQRILHGEGLYEFGVLTLALNEVKNAVLRRDHGTLVWRKFMVFTGQVEKYQEQQLDYSNEIGEAPTITAFECMEQARRHLNRTFDIAKKLLKDFKQIETDKRAVDRVGYV